MDLHLVGCNLDLRYLEMGSYSVVQMNIAVDDSVEYRAFRQQVRIEENIARC